MKKIILLLFSAMLTAGLQAQLSDEDVKKALERDIKTSGDYFYGEAVADTKEEAVEMAKTALASEINREILNHPEWLFTKDIQAKDIEYGTDIIDLMRGNKFRVIAYIKKDNLTALFDNTMPGVELSDKTTNPDKTENPQSTPITTAQPPQTLIKMEKFEGGVYTIPCKVNGLALKFIYDTGASDVVFSLSEANFMLKNGYLSESDILETNQYSIANGDIIEGTKIVLKEIEIGNLKLHNIEASIIHTSNAPLLLGQSALSKLGKIEFDYAQSILIIKGEPVTAQTTSTTPQSYQPVEETAPSTSQPIITNGDLLEQIVSASSMYGIQKILIAYKRKGKVAYGKMDKLLNQEAAYLIVYKHTGEIVAILDKGSNSPRRDLISGEIYGKEILSNNQIIWFQIFNK